MCSHLLIQLKGRLVTCTKSASEMQLSQLKPLHAQIQMKLKRLTLHGLHLPNCIDLMSIISHAHLWISIVHCVAMTIKLLFWHTHSPNWMQCLVMIANSALSTWKWCGACTPVVPRNRIMWQLWDMNTLNHSIITMLWLTSQWTQIMLAQCLFRVRRLVS